MTRSGPGALFFLSCDMACWSSCSVKLWVGMLGSAGRRGGSELSHSSCSDVVLFFHCCWANCSASTVARACLGWTLPSHLSLMCLGEYPFLVFLTGAHWSLAVPAAPCWKASSSQIFLSFLACFCNCFCRSSAC